MTKRIITPANFGFGICANEYPELFVTIDDMNITDPSLSSCGRFEEANPEEVYGISKDLVLAINLFNAIMADLAEQEKQIPEKLAAAFCRRLYEVIGEDMPEVIRRNDAETNEGICHTHDFTDANMSMMQAVIDIGLTANEDTFNVNDHVVHWNAAWNLAKQSKFNLK